MHQNTQFHIEKQKSSTPWEGGPHTLPPSVATLPRRRFSGNLECSLWHLCIMQKLEIIILKIWIYHDHHLFQWTILVCRTSLSVIRATSASQGNSGVIRLSTASTARTNRTVVRMVWGMMGMMKMMELMYDDNYCISCYFREGFIFTNFASQNLAKISTLIYVYL